MTRIGIKAPHLNNYLMTWPLMSFQSKSDVLEYMLSVNDKKDLNRLCWSTWLKQQKCHFPTAYRLLCHVLY